MIVITHRDFDKKYSHLRKKLQRQIDERLFLFQEDESHPILHNHPLHGIYAGQFSINITGDYRAIYELINGNTARFIDIDTHGKLYK